jgi:hypothetical protein
MSDQPTEKIVLNRGQDDLVFLYALTNLPLGNAMKSTHYRHGNLAFFQIVTNLPTEHTNTT